MIPAGTFCIQAINENHVNIMCSLFPAPGTKFYSLEPQELVFWNDRSAVIFEVCTEYHDS